MENIIVKNDGLRNKFNLFENDKIDENDFDSNDNYLYMNGTEIFNFTISNVSQLINNTLNKHNLTLETIDYIIFHQSNKYMLDYLRKKIKIPVEKFYLNMEENGNKLSATVPIT